MKNNIGEVDCTACSRFQQEQIAMGCPKHYPTLFCPECSRKLEVTHVQDGPDDIRKAGYCSEHGIIEL
jgi:predicted amidophosphoribosyltransferase